MQQRNDQMSLQPQFPGIFDPEQTGAPPRGSDSAQPRQADRRMPATQKQMDYARALARRSGEELPPHIGNDRAALSAWIDEHRPRALEGPFVAYPSAKQVAFAERIARLKRRDVPQECFRDKKLMARWIDGNKPR